MDVKVPDIKTNSWSLSEFSATRDRVLDISATAKTPARLFQQRGRNFLCAKTQEILTKSERSERLRMCFYMRCRDERMAMPNNVSRRVGPCFLY